MSFELVSIPDLVAARARACEICFGDGWVCESHPMRPVDTGSKACRRCAVSL